MVNYVFFGDSPTLESGFARVTKNLIPKLKLPNIHFWGLGYDGLNHEYDFKIYPANLNSNWLNDFNLDRFEKFLMSLEGTIVLWTIHDAFRLRKIINIIGRVREFKDVALVSYLPIDCYLTNEDIEFIQIVDIPVSYTEFGKRQIEKITDKRVFVLPHGNDTDFTSGKGNREVYFPDQQDSFIIGNINSNDGRKSLHRSLEILDELNAIEHKFKLYMHTNPTKPLNLKKIAFEMGVLPDVIFADPFFNKNQIIGKSDCSKEQLIEIYNSIDLFLSTSMGEGWGLTATEAASCETPIALPMHSSFKEIFSKKSCIALKPKFKTLCMGKLYPDLDVKIAAKQIYKEIKSGKLKKKVKKAKTIVDSHDWEKIAKKWNKIILSV